MVNAPNGQVHGSATNGTSSFKVEDFPIDSAHRKMKVAMIGAGFSGIMAGIRIPQRLRNCDLTIFEKNKDVGGTWFENHYPGLCCDIPAHCYSLTFEPNPNWSKFYAPGPEILKYLQNVSAKYNLHRFLKFRHKLVEAQWNEETSQWHLTFEVTDSNGQVTKVEDSFDFVIQGMGGLSQWDWPEIPGLQKFKGRLLHTAAYEGTEKDEQDRRVAVIGCGSSAIQVVPTVQPYAKQVDNYVRGKTWIATPFASTELSKRQPDLRNYTFTEEEKQAFAADPEAYHKWRHSLEAELNSVHEVTQKGSALQKMAVEAFKNIMLEKLAAKPEIAKAIIPNFAVACRRLTPGPGYLEALVEPNVGFITDHIAEVTENGIVTVDGTIREYDTIVCATGFDTSYEPRIDIVGRNGTRLSDLWSDVPQHYMSLAAGPDFPNWFIVNGPNSSLGSGSLLVLFERQVDYITEVIAKMQREQLAAISAKADAIKDYMEYIANYFERTVYSEKCRSWYKAGRELGPVIGLWPGSCLHAIKALKHPRWEDFDYQQRGQPNRFAWLGNGSAEEENGPPDSGLDRAFYLNEVDIPPVPALAK
ncbi:hypothetical protein OIV83_004496 [Microbotryomycetes sp. JL201]|nr:hypothetical protein OIV83_004496 [Microbotryomycetes sp. JL201]